MKESNLTIDTAKGLTTYLNSVESPIRIKKIGAEIILDTLLEHKVELYTDKEGKLYQRMAGSSLEETTIDDVVDLACEYNYEDSYLAGQSAENEPDFVTKCKEKKRHEELEARGRILNRIFYQTKYGRKVNLVADRICTELFTKLNLVPIYDVPFYQDKIVSEPMEYDVGKDSEDRVQAATGEQPVTFGTSQEQIDSNTIVTADSPAYTNEVSKEPEERSKGAR